MRHDFPGVKIHTIDGSYIFILNESQIYTMQERNVTFLRDDFNDNDKFTA